MKLTLFLCVVASFASSALRAQSAGPDTTVHRTRKDASTAVAWSVVIPGAGQMYAGQTLGGFALMATTAVAFGYYFQPRDTVSFRENCNGAGRADVCDVELGPRSKNGLIAGVGLWALSIATAPMAVRTHNERYDLSATVAPGASGSTRLGLAVRF